MKGVPWGFIKKGGEKEVRKREEREEEK